VRSTKLKDRSSTSDAGAADEHNYDEQHKRRCVFEKLASGDGPREGAGHHRHQYESATTGSSKKRHSQTTSLAGGTGSLDRSTRLGRPMADGGDPSGKRIFDNDNKPDDDETEPRRQYVAVQQGRDIPFKGLRKPAPQPNIYKGKHQFRQPRRRSLATLKAFSFSFPVPHQFCVTHTHATTTSCIIPPLTYTPSCIHNAPGPSCRRSDPRLCCSHFVSHHTFLLKLAQRRRLSNSTHRTQNWHANCIASTT
jgi:hypothetical protein